MVNSGIAAHIAAASPGGPRYDPQQSPSERGSLANGIWLCLPHAKLIDSDDSAYSADKLRLWKQIAEDLAVLRMWPGNTPQSVHELLGQNATDALAGYPGERMSQMAREDIDKFRHSVSWPVHVVPCRLTLSIGDKRTSLGLTEVAEAVLAYKTFLLTSPPGTGKSTTLVRLAEEILALGGATPCLIPLPELVAQPGASLLNAILAKAAFAEAGLTDLRHIASAGELVLLLDGWNELDSKTRQRVRQDLSVILREYPDTAIVLSTRHQASEPPISTHRRLGVEPLTSTQQREFARRVGGDEGEKRFSDAVRIPELRELASVPLFLTAIVGSISSEPLSSSRESVLSAFIEAVEQRSRKRSESLEGISKGLHRNVLVELAMAGMAEESTSLTDVYARKTVSAIYEQAISAKQIAVPPDPGDVLDVLVAEHVLVRIGEGGYQFQHQQFQEWFASFGVEGTMRAAQSGDMAATERLREILDNRLWEHSVMFACQRLATGTSGEVTVAFTFDHALAIDPMLAADIIHACASIWPLVKSKAMVFATQWHVPGRVDRSVGFMLSTGMPEFLPQLEPLFRSSDHQVRLHAYSAGKRFHATIFGKDPEQLLLSFPEDDLLEILLELIERGNISDAELARSIAAASNSVRIQTRIAEDFYYRNYDSDFVALLSVSNDEVWANLSKLAPDEGAFPAEVTERLKNARRHHRATATDPAHKLRLLLDEPPAEPAEFDKQLAALLEDPSLPADKDQAHHLFNRAAELNPQITAKAVLARTENNLSLPYRARDLVVPAEPGQVSEGLTQLLLGKERPSRRTEVAAKVASKAIVVVLLEKLTRLASERVGPGVRLDSTTSEEYFDVRAVLGHCSTAVVIDALASFPGEKDVRAIEVLASLLIGEVGKRLPPLEGLIQTTCDEMLVGWARRIMADEGGRSAAASVAAAIGTVGSQAIGGVLLELLDYDLREWRRERADKIKPGMQFCHTPTYRRAIVALAAPTLRSRVVELLTHPDFAVDAAYILRDVIESKPASGSQSDQWSDNSFLGLARRSRRQTTRVLTTDPSALAMLSAAEGFEASESHDLAVQLTAVATRLISEDQTDRVKRLLCGLASDSSKLLLAQNSILNGVPLESGVIVSCIKAALDDAKSKPWLLDPNQGSIDRWLNVLAFTDDPKQLISVLKELPSWPSQPYRRRDLLSALGVAGGAGAEATLFMLALEDPRYYEQYEWWSALESLGSISAAERVLTLIRDGNVVVAGLKSSANETAAQKILASGMASSPELRRAVYAALRTESDPRVGQEIAASISLAPDNDGVICLVAYEARCGTETRRHLYEAIKHMTVAQVPIPEYESSYNVFSVPADDLRRRLIEMVGCADTRLVDAAANALLRIDENHDEWGFPEKERRHPGIKSGVAWPRLN